MNKNCFECGNKNIFKLTITIHPFILHPISIKCVGYYTTSDSYPTSV